MGAKNNSGIDFNQLNEKLTTMLRNPLFLSKKRNKLDGLEFAGCSLKREGVCNISRAT
jgi:hypothetical protein